MGGEVVCLAEGGSGECCLAGETLGAGRRTKLAQGYSWVGVLAWLVGVAARTS
jgi:hypothetical protein